MPFQRDQRQRSLLIREELFAADFFDLIAADSLNPFNHRHRYRKVFVRIVREKQSGVRFLFVGGARGLDVVRAAVRFRQLRIGGDAGDVENQRHTTVAQDRGAGQTAAAFEMPSQRFDDDLFRIV